MIVSDNASDDGTQELAASYALRVPGLRYSRNEANLGADDNFLRATSLAKGRYIHLLSDKACLLPGALAHILGIIGRHDAPVILLLNGAGDIRPGAETTCHSFDEFVTTVSYWSTWMSGIVVRRRDLVDRCDLGRAKGTKLIQTDWVFQIVSSTPGAVITNERLIDEKGVGAKGGYNLFEVFVENYLGLYAPYVERGLLRRGTLKAEERKLLTRFVFPWYTRSFLQKRDSFDLARTHSIILRRYWSSPFLYAYPAYLIRSLLGAVLAKFRHAKPKVGSQ
jgi:glycosyltransferase involved in cell wall biosynthesis